MEKVTVFPFPSGILCSEDCVLCFSVMYSLPFNSQNGLSSLSVWGGFGNADLSDVDTYLLKVCSFFKMHPNIPFCMKSPLVPPTRIISAFIIVTSIPVLIQIDFTLSFIMAVQSLMP